MRRLLTRPSADPPLSIDADLRPEGKGGRPDPLPVRLPQLLQPLVLHLGDAGPGPGRRDGRRHRARGRADGADRRQALARGRTVRQLSCTRSASSRRGSRPSGCRAGPTRPSTPSSARAGWPTSSGRCRCCSCSTRTPYRRCARPAHHRGAARGPASGSDRPAGRRPPGGGLGAGQQDQEPDHAGPRPGLGLVAQRQPGAGRGRGAAGLRRRASPRTCWPTTAASPGGPTAWSTGCSGDRTAEPGG